MLRFSISKVIRNIVCLDTSHGVSRLSQFPIFEVRASQSPLNTQNATAFGCSNGIGNNSDPVVNSGTQMLKHSNDYLNSRLRTFRVSTERGCVSISNKDWIEWLKTDNREEIVCGKLGCNYIHRIDETRDYTIDNIEIRDTLRIKPRKITVKKLGRPKVIPEIDHTYRIITPAQWITELKAGREHKY